MEWLVRFNAKLGHWVNNRLDQDAFNRATDAQIAGDHKAALAQFEDLAKQGHAAAAKQAGGYYVTGKHVKVDGRKALKYFEIGHAAGDLEATGLLGSTLASGMPGVAKDYVKALPLLEIAVKNGDVKAKQVLDVVNKKLKR